MIKQLILAILLLIPAVSAAQIQGNVYNNYLEPSMAVVSVNTDPVQKLVVKNSYRFNIPVGTYTITANYNSLKTEETVIIKQDGIYTLDLIMFPDFENEESLLNFNIDTSYEKKSYWYFYLIGIGLVLIIISFFIKKKKSIKEEQQLPEQPSYENKPEQKEEPHYKNNPVFPKAFSEKGLDELANKLLNFIKASGGRVTQKEIRNQFPFSEAKISLLITDLESKGILKKIKKGRTNVIILQ